MDEIKLTLNDDGTFAFDLPTTTGRVTVVLQPDTILTLMRALGDIRPQLPPPIPDLWTMERQVVAVTDPRFFTEPDAMQANSVLHLRDPRYGWLSYLLPPESAKTLGELLIRQTEITDPSQAKPGKAN